MPIAPDLRTLLSLHGLDRVQEQPFTHTGFSGAELTRIVRDDGAAFVLKRMSVERDWIMRATDDVRCREAAFAAAGIDLGERVRTPALGAAHDGGGFALLMRDISADLLSQRPISKMQLDSILEGMAALHALHVPAAGIPWCDVTGRLTLLTPAGAKIAAAYGAPVAADLEAGWRLFDRHASPSAVKLIHGLYADPSPLVRALAELPSRFLHGDLKLDNIGIDPSGRLWLIDWAMTLIAPPAIELGWFLAINSRRLPVSLDEVMESYAARSGMRPEDRARHDALTVLCGLLLRGWRKALDAEAGEPEELRWWCDRAGDAIQYL